MSRLCKFEEHDWHRLTTTGKYCCLVCTFLLDADEVWQAHRDIELARAALPAQTIDDELFRRLVEAVEVLAGIKGSDVAGAIEIARKNIDFGGYDGKALREVITKLGGTYREKEQPDHEHNRAELHRTNYP